jgi:hypothetical protein
MSAVAGMSNAVTDEEIVAGLLAGREPRAVVSGGAVGALEIGVGLPMPGLFERVHREVSDGGYIPWAFAVGEDNGFEWCCGGGECCGGATVLAEYTRRLREHRDHPAPVVPIWHRQGHWVFVDFSTPEGRIWRSRGEESAVPAEDTLNTWLAAQLAEANQQDASDELRAGGSGGFSDQFTGDDPWSGPSTGFSGDLPF